MLELKGVSLSYGERTVLKDISLTLRTNQAIGISGPSGGGKTTLIKITALQKRPTEGHVELDGKRVSRKALSFARIVHLDQHLYLWPHLTVRENINLPLRHASFPLVESVLHSLMNMMEVDKLLDRYPREISGGQRQRVALIRSLTVSPRYLLLDEPTSALDRKSIDRVIRVLKFFKKSGGALLISSHNTYVLNKLCEEIYTVEKGKLHSPELRSAV